MWRGADAQLADRLNDHIRATNRAFDTLIAEQRAHATRSEAGISDLSAQLRGQVEALHKSVDARHRENLNRMWFIAVSVGAVIIGALATSYLAEHGLANRQPDAVIAKAVQHMEDTLKSIQTENKLPIRPGLGG